MPLVVIFVITFLVFGSSIYTTKIFDNGEESQIKFSCSGQPDGYYADMNHQCLVFHYCNSTNIYAHHSFTCTQEFRYDQILGQCVKENEAITKCQDSALYFPSRNNDDSIVVITSNNRFFPNETEDLSTMYQSTRSE